MISLVNSSEGGTVSTVTRVSSGEMVNIIASSATIIGNAETSWLTVVDTAICPCARGGPGDTIQ